MPHKGAVPQRTVLLVVRAQSLGPLFTMPLTLNSAMPPLGKNKTKFHGLTDLGAGVARVLLQAHSQEV